MDNKIYQSVTDRIIAALESGTAPWHKSWKDDAGTEHFGAMRRPLRACGTPYTGVNVLNLWAAAQQRGFKSAHWFTFNGAKEKGAAVRKGAKAELAFFVGRHNVTDTDKNGEETERAVSFLRFYYVFNADEIDGLPAKFYGEAAPVAAPVVEGRIATADAFVANTGATIRHGGNRAFYSPATDSVTMPLFAQFDAPVSYYATLLHELAHWTSAEPRCNRELGKRFGDSAYAAEELVAELSAAFLCADLGLSAEPRADHAAYLASWLSVLKADNRAIFKAAALADKAAGFLHGLQPSAPEGDGEPIAAPAPAPVAEPIAEPPTAEHAPARRQRAAPKPAKGAAKPAPAKAAKPAPDAPAVKCRDSYRAALAAAHANVAAAYGQRWDLRPECFIWARVPARYRAKFSDYKLPRAEYWPSGQLPSGLAVAETGARYWRDDSPRGYLDPRVGLIAGFSDAPGIFA